MGHSKRKGPVEALGRGNIIAGDNATGHSGRVVYELDGTVIKSHLPHDRD